MARGRSWRRVGRRGSPAKASGARRSLRPGVRHGPCPAAGSAAALGDGPVVGVPVRATVLLHLRLEEVSPALHQAVTSLALQLLEQPVVAVVVVLDDLEGPPPLDDVAADQAGAELAGERVVTGLLEQVHVLAQGQVAHAGEPMEGVEVPASVL